MKIVAIIGSPRKGNTYKTIQLVEQIHKDIVDCEYEYIFLKDINLLPCKGCFVCISNGEEFCPLKDDNEWLSRRIEDADGVIVSSPNYAANVTSLMKNYIDRNAYICHRPKFFGKKFMLVVSSGSTMGIRAASKALSILVSGGKIVSRLHVITSPSLSSSQKKKEELKIRKVSKQFANKLCHSQRNRHPFSYLIWFSVFKAASNRSKKHFPADYEYYKDREYFVIDKNGPLQKLLIRLFTNLFRFMPV